MAYWDLSPKAAPGVDGVTWAGLRAGPGGQPPGPARPGSQRALPGAAVSAGVHPEGGRAAAAARHRRRWRHSAASSSDPLGFVIVTHPFHPLNGQRLEILYAKRRGADTVFVCAGGCQRADDAAAGVDRPGRAARGWPAVGRGARRARRCDTRTAGSLIVMPGSGILFCDERAKERDETSLAGMSDAAAAVAAARPGRAARRRRAGAVRLADRADAAVRQGPAAGAPAASRTARMPSSPRRPRPGAGLRYVPASLAGVVRRYLRNGEEIEQLLAEISAINAELLARRELQ